MTSAVSASKRGRTMPLLCAGGLLRWEPAVLPSVESHRRFLGRGGSCCSLPVLGRHLGHLGARWGCREALFGGLRLRLPCLVKAGGRWKCAATLLK
uniref:Uncharacterized protein n=1 Tax=Ixodes ricinus TaxID=34613 RepID=A0A6B0UA58_IXORI